MNKKSKEIQQEKWIFNPVPAIYVSQTRLKTVILTQNRPRVKYLPD